MFVMEKETMMQIFNVGDTLVMKKEHPCGGKRFSVLYAASDVKIRCETCGREMLMPRVKLEKCIKTVVSGDKNDQ